MDGRDILNALVTERLELLDTEPREVQTQSSGHIFSFCNGAGEALVKAGLLSIPDKAAVIDRLIGELESRKLGGRISATVRETAELTVMPPEAESDT